MHKMQVTVSTLINEEHNHYDLDVKAQIGKENSNFTLSS
jgi:hypothetical protein